MIYLLYATAVVWLVFAALILWAVWPQLSDGGSLVDYALAFLMVVFWPGWLGLSIVGAWREERKRRLLNTQPIKPIDRQDF